MKYLLTLLLLVSASVFGSGVILHNESRSGEGIYLVEKNGKQAFAFFTYFDSNFAIPPIVSPKPPPPLHPITPCHNCPTWYLGIEGTLYMSQALDYPETLDNELNHEFAVGAYVLKQSGVGYTLEITSNGVLPDSLFMFNHVFTFTSKIFGD